MYWVKRVGFFVLGVIAFGGCRAAHDVAVSSFHVLDAPANYVRHHIEGQTETTTTTASSDTVTTPGRTVTASTPPSQQRRTTTTTTQTNPSPGPRSSPATVTEKSRPSPSPSRSASTQAQIPTAKKVPGKPGYVFSPFDPGGGYVDVTGYSPGQKVKDPYSGKIFLVP
jgi:hypothetical protein